MNGAFPLKMKRQIFIELFYNSIFEIVWVGEAGRTGAEGRA